MPGLIPGADPFISSPVCTYVSLVGCHSFLIVEPCHKSSQSLHLNYHTINAIILSVNSSSHSNDNQRTKLDSHANMAVLRKHASTFESTGWPCDVQPFAKELGIASNVPIMDGGIAYNCHILRKTFILMARNALHIPTISMRLTVMPWIW